MRTKKVVLDYSGFNDDALNTLAGKVLECLEGHATFTELPVPLADLTLHVTDFREKWQRASRGGSTLDNATRDDAKKVLAASLKNIAFYVNNVANGSRSLLLSSGLQLEADPKPSPVPDVLRDVALRDGKQKNQMDILFKPLSGSGYIYEYEIADQLDEAGDPIWKHTFQTGNSRANIFAPTTPDVTYYLRVRARNKKGIGDWSQVASLKAR